MTSPLTRVLLIGAGGRLGPSILSAFDADPRFTLSILARQPSTSTFPPHIKVHSVSDDYPEAGLLEALKGQDAVVSTMATANLHQQRAIIDAAIKVGVKRFVPSEFGSDTLNEKAMALLPQYFKGKKDTVDYLKTKEKEGLTWSAFVTGPFFELGMAAGVMGYNLQERKVSLINGGKDTWSTTTMPTIGLAVKNSLLIPDNTANQYIFIDSFTVSQSQVLASFEKATGKKWDVELVDAEAMKNGGLEKLKKGDFSGAMSIIRYINCVHGHGGNYSEYEKTANGLLSLPTESLDEAVANVLKA